MSDVREKRGIRKGKKRRGWAPSEKKDGTISKQKKIEREICQREERIRLLGKGV